MFGLQMVDDASFGEVVERAEGLVLVDFTAAWCPPCRLIAPILAELAEEYASRLAVVSLDADLNPATVARFGARGLPTLVFFRDGLEVDRSIGAVPRAVLQARIESVLAAAGERVNG
jgi:thioredoxin 1